MGLWFFHHADLSRVVFSVPAVTALWTARPRAPPGTDRERDVIAHIDLGLDEKAHPGIQGPLRFRPETAKPLGELTEVLLRAPHPTLTRASGS
ncbi:hypothetical protein [Micromonospora sp. b486]|uniref:hypothetical protein n=1 Tax=Micromonospora sp. b486 TaxID=3053986 RepID=UPI00259D2BAE|nr:hypothetical protein [Micromonospora sp. b486]MDM4777973.1 hypothetical protein [Micromonospora sp. b486]